MGWPNSLICPGKVRGFKLSLTNKGWFGNSNAVIHSGEGPIYTIQWLDNYIAWANDAGVRIYNTVSQQKFAFIEHNVAESRRADLFRCNLYWKKNGDDAPLLFVGWADSVKIGRVIDRGKIDVASGLPRKSLEIIAQFKTEFVISGIAPLNDDLVILLAFMTDVEEEAGNVNVISDTPVKKKVFLWVYAVEIYAARGLCR